MSKLSTPNNKATIRTLKDHAPKQKWVVKIGSSLITNHGAGLHRERLRAWCTDILALRTLGVDVILVSSGAIAEGCARLGFSQRPSESHLQQAAAAVGQAGLVQAYQTIFSEHNVHCAQVLLTHSELEDRERYLNARSTIHTLLSLGVVPIVNENDTVATDEIRFGDNDTLGALVANLVEANVFVMMTDQDALYTADPTQDPLAQPIQEADADDPSLLQIAGSTSSSGLGSGGMYTKVIAARLAARSGAVTHLVSGLTSEVLQRLYRGESIGTRFNPKQAVLSARKRWLAGQLKPKGKLMIDSGAVEKICHNGKSLLPVGVRSVVGAFSRGDVVECMSLTQERVAVGLANYSAKEVQLMLGHSSKDMLEILGYVGEPELIHRDNMVILG